MGESLDQPVSVLVIREKVLGDPQSVTSARYVNALCLQPRRKVVWR